MSVEYLFRDWSAMPLIEKKSISVSYWKTLDVGSGAGSHSLYLQNEKTRVTAIDISPKAIKT
jgi:methylase of polypeptide subunit release factors